MARPKQDSTQFTPEELKDLEAQAVAEFEAESKKEASEAFKEETKRKLRQKQLFAAGKDADGEDTESVTIALAPHSAFICLDGRLFYNDVTYKFTKAQAATVKEIMFRTWQHEKSVGGANINAMNGATPINRVLNRVGV